MKALAYVVAGAAAGMASIGCVREAGSGTSPCYITCGAAGSLVLRSSDPAEKPAREVALSVPLHCLAVNPASTQVAVADDSHFVRLYKLPGLGEPEVATRFALPVRAVAYSPDGTKLAAAGDDEGIKLVNVTDTKVLRTFKAGPYTRSLAYDPDGEYVASVSADGCLQVFHVTGKAELRLPRVAPKVDTASAARCLSAWHPDGSLLAVPGCSNDVTVYERLSWEPAFSLSDQHSMPVNAVCFSPDGSCAVTAGQDRLLVLWDVEQRSVVATRSTPDTVSDMAWHAEANTLACITESSGVVLWADIVPEGMRVHSASPEGAKKSTEDRPASSHLDGSKDADLADFIERDTPEPGKPSSHALGAAHTHSLRRPAPQGAIQPGSTPSGESRRRWMAFSLLGCISSQVEDGQSVVEVAFHDATSHRRVPLFSDFRDFCMAALGPKGALYASAAAAGSPPMVVYRPFQSWVSGGDWTFTLPADGGAACVAAGKNFCAIATSDRMLRTFTLSGVQLSVVSLPGAPVALAAQGNTLAAVWHASVPADDCSQVLEYSTYDYASQSLAAPGRLPLSAGAGLAWLGFGEDSELAAYDTAVRSPPPACAAGNRDTVPVPAALQQRVGNLQGVMRMRSSSLGNTWVPVFSAATDGKPGEVYWPVGLSGGELLCIICSAAAQHPRVVPRPALSRLALRVPVLSSGDGAVAQLEADMLRRNAMISHLRELAGPDESDETEDRLAVEEAEADRTVLRLFQAALKAEKLGRALDLAACLALPQSLEGALRLARHHRAPALVERLQALQQSQQSQLPPMEEAPSSAPTPPDVTARDDAHEPVAVEGGSRFASHALPPREAAASRSPIRQTKAAALCTSTRANMAALRGEDDTSAKRKAPAVNPFARKPKAPKL